MPKDRTVLGFKISRRNKKRMIKKKRKSLFILTDLYMSCSFELLNKSMKAIYKRSYLDRVESVVEQSCCTIKITDEVLNSYWRKYYIEKRPKDIYDTLGRLQQAVYSCMSPSIR
jgi:hypothetical protein